MKGLRAIVVTVVADSNTTLAQQPIQLSNNFHNYTIQQLNLILRQLIHSLYITKDCATVVTVVADSNKTLGNEGTVWRDSVCLLVVVWCSCSCCQCHHTEECGLLLWQWKLCESWCSCFAVLLCSSVIE